MRTPVIVLCAFGTSTEAMATYDHIDEVIRSRYPDNDIRWAFTSEGVIRKLRGRGIACYTLPEVYEILRREGKTEVLVQSLHIMPGQEFHEKIVMVPAKGLNVKYGLPLLSEDDDFERLFKALEPRFPPEEEAVTILCAHGNKRRPEFNAPFLRLDSYIRGRRKNTFVATVDGPPGTESAFSDAKAAGVGRVHFVPLMLVAGRHIMEDVMGEGENSWKNQLSPMKATVEEGLGYNDDVIEIYIEHIGKALDQF
ncbi:sirohydrochlorin cobaltochelatase [Candidatus Poribacteria bacterium]|nr:sirohydrochlorin cobaltochelatase [Candidatus Poribacteria bacterium]